MGSQVRIALVGVIISIILTIFVASCGENSPTSPAGCEAKGYTTKICATTGENVLDSYEWNGTSLINQSIETHEYPGWWGVVVWNEVSSVLDACIEGDYDSSRTGLEFVFGYDEGAGADNEYPNGPPCVYFRIH